MKLKIVVSNSILFILTLVFLLCSLIIALSGPGLASVGLFFIAFLLFIAGIVNYLLTGVHCFLRKKILYFYLLSGLFVVLPLFIDAYIYRFKDETSLIFFSALLILISICFFVYALFRFWAYYFNISH